MTAIDAHQHFWDPAARDYGWLRPGNEPLYRRFGPEHLYPLMERTGVAGVVLVQAMESDEETEHLLALADETPWIVGVVGWIDLDRRDFVEHIAQRRLRSKLVGVRPMLQDLPPDWILHPGRADNLSVLARSGLVFDALIRAPHAHAVMLLAQRHGDLVVIIDHAAKPAIRSAPDPTWLQSMRRLAALANVSCKISGLLTEMSDGAAHSDVVAHIHALIDIFGPRRLLWGSDWPVLNAASNYEVWANLVRQAMAGLGAADRDAIMGANAQRLYGLAPP